MLLVHMDYIGKAILSKLMNDWKLMHELAVLRSIYLLGSGTFYVASAYLEIGSYLDSK